MSKIDRIRLVAEPLHYAISHLQHGTPPDAIISADVGYLYADDDGHYLTLQHITRLLHSIYTSTNPMDDKP